MLSAVPVAIADSLSNLPTPLPLEVVAIEGALTLDYYSAVATAYLKLLQYVLVIDCICNTLYSIQRCNV